MSARLPTNINLSLGELARHGGLTGPHRDGWGVAFYQEREAWVVKEPVAAAESKCERFLERNRIRSSIVLSHIRHATQGAVSFENTQPFARELGGRSHVFAHNGDLAGVERLDTLRPSRFRPCGETDSEYAFCLLLKRLESLWLDGDGEIPALDLRLPVVQEFASSLRPLGPANFLYTDGDAVFVHGHRRRQPGREGTHPPGLHVLCRRCSGEADRGGSVPGIELESTSEVQEVFLAASVPLTLEGWRPLEEGELVVARGGSIVPLRSL